MGQRTKKVLLAHAVGRGRGSPPVDSAAHAAALGSLEGADAVNLEADKPAPVYVTPAYGGPQWSPGQEMPP